MIHTVPAVGFDACGSAFLDAADYFFRSNEAIYIVVQKAPQYTPPRNLRPGFVERIWAC